ncbi:hypothetical protein CEXT_616351 [Caerostris extrusa]|uniref:Uncharacterized protein n=1 Tax=Caerostris extrusa TaxID=172846 RepID=A0AAV4W969_CAEEX|nr:hypothetical protein CEXT_616351 [Caerostris extrusa]
MEDHCFLPPGEPFRSRRDKIHQGINKEQHIRLPHCFKPSASRYGVSNRKLFRLCCGGVLPLAYGLHKSKKFSPPARHCVHYVRNNTLGRNSFSVKIMEHHCSFLAGEPFRNRRDKFHPGIKKNKPHDFPTLLNPPPATMGYPTASISFSAVAVCLV